MQKLRTILTTLLVLTAAAALAAVPHFINFQGILRDGSGNPVANGSYSVTFRIYDDPAAGNVLWSESTSVSTTSGLFTVRLGSLNPVPDSAFNDTSRYLGIKVAADPEMTPRERLATVPYSYRTSTVDGASGGTITGDVGIGAAPGAFVKLNVVASTGTGVEGTSPSGIGVSGNSNSGTGVSGICPSGKGVLGDGGIGTGVYGIGNTFGVYANSFNGTGLYAESPFGTAAVRAQGGANGVIATGGTSGVDATGVTYGVVASGTIGVDATGATYGVYGHSTGAAAVFGDIGGNFGTYGGYFQGDVRIERNLVVVGTVFKGGAGFQNRPPA